MRDVVSNSTDHEKPMTYFVHRVGKDFVRSPGIPDDGRSNVVSTQVLLPDAPSRWRSFGTGLLLQFFAVFVLVTIPILFPDKFEPVRHYLVSVLTRPELPKVKLHLKTTMVAPRPQPVAPELSEATPAPRIYLPAAAPVAKPVTSRRSEPSAVTPEVASVIASPAPLPLPALAVPTLVRPRDEVHTGIFGANDESGPSNSANSGHGRGGVVNAKFSDGRADGVVGGTDRRVASSGFLDSRATSADPKPKKELPSAPAITPVKIVLKPRPTYTAEARSRKIEGEVVLKVIFAASGNVQVLSVVSGLGFGLDESAENAAARIQFQPAKHDGQPVDVTATVHIVFELAE